MPQFNLPAIALPGQLVNAIAIVFGLLAMWVFFNGLFYIGVGFQSWGAARGRPDERNKAWGTMQDGFFGAVGGAFLGAIIVFVRTTLGV
jgi:hypothetical protein